MFREESAGCHLETFAECAYCLPAALIVMLSSTCARIRIHRRKNRRKVGTETLSQPTFSPRSFLELATLSTPVITNRTNDLQTNIFQASRRLLARGVGSMQAPSRLSPVKPLPRIQEDNPALNLMLLC